MRGADIINVITKASNPVLGEWLEPGQHINAAGSNALTRRELDELRSSARASSSTRAALRATNAATCCRWSRAASSTGTRCPNSGEVIIGRVAGAASRDEITLYESHGMGIQDIYTGTLHPRRSRSARKNIGIDLPIGVQLRKWMNEPRLIVKLIRQ